MLTLQEYLDGLNIEYWEEGKNVTEGWINIECIFCDDSSNHLGINLSDGHYSCWICEAYGSLINLISSLENVSFGQAARIAKHIKLGESGALLPPAVATTVGKFAGLPKTSSNTFPKKHINYLLKRRFDPYALIRKYKLRACHTIGLYRFRIIVPFFLNRKMVTFTSLDVTGKQEPKYLHCPIRKSEVDPKHMLYNIDSIKRRAVIVEGVTDVWRLGDGAVAVMGTEYVREQIELLGNRDIDAAIVMFDSDAVKKGEKFAYQLCGVIKNVDVIELKAGDPDDLPLSKVKQIQRFIKKG